MTRLQFVAGLFVTGCMALAGGMLATFMLQSGKPVHAQEEKAGTVTASEFRLVDAKGNPRAAMSTNDKGAVLLTFFDKDLKPRMQLGADGDQASLSFLDGEGTPRYLVAQTNKDNNVLITFQDAKGRPRYLQSLDAEGAAMLAFRGPKEEDLLNLLAGPGKASSLILNDPGSKQNVLMFAGEGQSTLILQGAKSNLLQTSMETGAVATAMSQGKVVRQRTAMSEAGVPEFLMNDKAGKYGILLGLTEEDQSIFGLAKDGKLRVRAMTGADGTPELILLNEKKEATWRAGK